MIEKRERSATSRAVRRVPMRGIVTLALIAAFSVVAARGAVAQSCPANAHVDHVEHHDNVKKIICTCNPGYQKRAGACAKAASPPPVNDAEVKARRARAALREQICHIREQIEVAKKGIEALGFEHGAEELKQWNELAEEHRDRMVKAAVGTALDAFMYKDTDIAERMASLTPGKAQRDIARWQKTWAKVFPSLPTKWRAIARTHDKRERVALWLETLKAWKGDGDLADLSSDYREIRSGKRDWPTYLEATLDVLDASGEFAPKSAKLFAEPLKTVIMAAKLGRGLGETGVPLVAYMVYNPKKAVEDLSKLNEDRLKILQHATKNLATLVEKLNRDKAQWKSLTGGAALPKCGGA